VVHIDHVEILKNIWSGATSISEFIHALCMDGCNEWTAREVFLLCQQGNFEDAAHHAHMGGWL